MEDTPPRKCVFVVLGLAIASKQSNERAIANEVDCLKRNFTLL
jgi:hypothetical protein